MGEFDALGGKDQNTQSPEKSEPDEAKKSKSQRKKEKKAAKEAKKQEENENPPIPEAPSETNEILEDPSLDLKKFQESLESPTVLVELQEEYMNGLADGKLKTYLEKIIRPYIIAHYLDNAETLIGHMCKLNSVGMADLIRSKGKLVAFAKGKKIEPVKRIQISSPFKMAGNHPLKSNQRRTFTISATRTQTSSSASNSMLEVAEKLFPVVKGMGGHSICITPFNPLSTAKSLSTIEEVTENVDGLAGIYVMNTLKESWNSKLSWEFKVTTSLDMVYLLNKSNSACSSECEALKHYLGQKHIQLSIIDVETSNFVRVAMVVNTTKMDNTGKCKEELCQRLMEQRSFTLDPKWLSLDWETHIHPDHPEMLTMSLTVKVDPRAEKGLFLALTGMTSPCEVNEYPFTHAWEFYKADNSPSTHYSLEMGIKSQKKFLSELLICKVTGVGDEDILTKCPEVNGRGWPNSSKMTVLKLWLETDSNGHGHPDGLPSPFRQVYQNKDGHILFMGPQSRRTDMQIYLAGAFQIQLQRWFPNQAWTHGVKISIPPNRELPPAEELEKSTENSRAVQQERANAGNGSSIPVGNPNLVPPSTTNPYVTIENFSVGTGNTGSTNSSMTSTVVHSICSQLRQQLPMDLERALSVTDPAGRFATLLNTLLYERDQYWKNEITPRLWEEVDGAVTLSMENNFQRLCSEYGVVVAKAPTQLEPTAGAPTNNLTKPQHPLTNPKTATNDTALPEEQGGDRPSTTTKQVTLTPAVNKTAGEENFLTPASEASVIKQLTQEASQIEHQMDQKMLSFENIAETLSPIKDLDNTEGDILTPGTKELKKQLENTLEKSRWDANLTTDSENITNPNEENKGVTPVEGQPKVSASKEAAPTPDSLEEKQTIKANTSADSDSSDSSGIPTGLTNSDDSVAARLKSRKIGKPPPSKYRGFIHHI